MGNKGKMYLGIKFLSCQMLHINNFVMYFMLQCIALLVLISILDLVSYFYVTYL
jgi:hypothetical protein